MILALGEVRKKDRFEGTGVKKVFTMARYGALKFCVFST